MARTAYIADPFSAGADRYAGINRVRSVGAVATRREAALLVSDWHTDIPSYVVNFNVAATAAMDVLSLPGTGTKVLRLRRIVLVNPGSATGAIIVDLQLGIATGVGSGGSVATVQALDQATRANGVFGGPDGAFSGARMGDTTQAGGFISLYNPLVSVSVPATAAAFTPQVIYDARDPRVKPVTVGASAGFTVAVLRVPSIGAGATGFRGYAEFAVDDA